MAERKGYQRRINLTQIESGVGEYESLGERISNIELGATGSNRFLFKQETPIETWNILHSLGFKYPNVKVIDSDGNIIVADIDYQTSNYLEIHFGIPTSGEAYLVNNFEGD